MTRISQSYEQLREKRRQQQVAQEESKESTTRITELKDEVDRAKCAAHAANMELKKALDRVESFEARQQELERRDGTPLTQQMLEEMKTSAEKSVLASEYNPSLLPASAQQTVQLLQQLLDKHFKQLALELQMKSDT